MATKRSIRRLRTVTAVIWWHLARAGGIVALILAALAVVCGLLLAGRFGNSRPAPRWVLATHRFLGSRTLTFTGIHIGGPAAA